MQDIFIALNLLCDLNFSEAHKVNVAGQEAYKLMVITVLVGLQRRYTFENIEYTS